MKRYRIQDRRDRERFGLNFRCAPVAVDPIDAPLLERHHYSANASCGQCADADIRNRISRAARPHPARRHRRLKTWELSVYHSLRKPYLQANLDEFVFRFNRRKTRHAAFENIRGIATTLKSKTYKVLIAQEING